MTHPVLILQLLAVIIATLHDVIFQVFDGDVIMLTLRQWAGLVVGDGARKRQLRAHRRERLGRRAGCVTRRRLDEDAAVVRRRSRLH